MSLESDRSFNTESYGESATRAGIGRLRIPWRPRLTATSGWTVIVSFNTESYVERREKVYGNSGGVGSVGDGRLCMREAGLTKETMTIYGTS